MAAIRPNGRHGDSLEDFISELNDIEQGKAQSKKDSSDDHSEDELSKTPDEGEQEAAWLQDVGYGHLVDSIEEGREIGEERLRTETRSLTKSQAAAVKKRVNTLNATVRKRQRAAATPGAGSKTDVREVFTGSQTGVDTPARPQPRVYSPQPSPKFPKESLAHAHKPVAQRSSGGRIKTREMTSSFMKKSGGYSMADGNVPSHSSGGVQTLSIQSRTMTARMYPSNHHYSNQPTSPAMADTAPESLSLSSRTMSARMTPSAGGRGDLGPGRGDLGPGRGDLGPVTELEHPMTFTLTESNSSGSTTNGVHSHGEPAESRPQSQSRVASVDRLPEYTLVTDDHGITRVSDLSFKDRAKVRHLALIELSALYDIHNITYTRRKRKKRYKEHGVYGVPLQTLIEHDRKKHPASTHHVPRIFAQLIDFLEKHGIDEEGILRVPGSVNRIKQLRTEIEDKFNSNKFSWSEVRANDAAGLMKQFLRELPVPLLTFEYLEAFAKIGNIKDIMEQIQALNLLFLLLPDVHRETLQMLLRFLRNVVEHQENRMTLNNVAMIMAPNLFLVQSSHKSKAIKDFEVTMAAGTSNIVRMMMKYQDLLVTVPGFMLTQVRHQYDTDNNKKTRDKSIMKFLGRREKPTEKHHNDSEVQDGIIRVQGEQVDSSPLAVRLDVTMTVADVTRRLAGAGAQNGDVTAEWERRLAELVQPELAQAEQGRVPRRLRPSYHGDSGSRRHPRGENGTTVTSSPHPSYCMYEVGGNIGERKLDPNANMLKLLRTNPHADWVIKRDVT